MNEPNRSLKRDNKAIIDLVTPSNKPHIVGMKVVCACSDLKEREVIMDSKLAAAIMGFIKHRQGGTLQLSEGIPIRIPIKKEAPPVSEDKGDKMLKCGRCAGELFGNYAHKESGKFRCADQAAVPRVTCILDCDSPSLPPSNQERMQCGCEQCRKDLT